MTYILLFTTPTPEWDRPVGIGGQPFPGAGVPQLVHVLVAGSYSSTVVMP
jgi:hypothetical protein